MQQVRSDLVRDPGSIVFVHSSDLHIDTSSAFDSPDLDPLVMLRRVVRTAVEVSADVLILAGDLFEHNRLPTALLERAAQCLADAHLPIVVLPGNHDPLTPDSVYQRGRFSELSAVNVIGMSGSSSVIFESLDLEIWGHAHVDYGDMRPLRTPLPRKTRWQVAVAHGHVAEPPYAPRYRPSWLISRRDVNETRADYVALGHWDRDKCISTGPVAAYYSGSPGLTGRVNVVNLHGQGAVRVTRHPVSRDSD